MRTGRFHDGSSRDAAGASGHVGGGTGAPPTTARPRPRLSGADPGPLTGAALTGDELTGDELTGADAEPRDAS
ncbi:hypothetical protein AB0M02_16815 [Actinoplanes sp. NPDC051861]|uniref:hypothetical protein n=1 Tax=Actinoplanes sp. NPDC051861 TaxID=3155170 RepID=UPI0034309905